MYLKHIQEKIGRKDWSTSDLFLRSLVEREEKWLTSSKHSEINEMFEDF